MGRRFACMRIRRKVKTLDFCAMHLRCQGDGAVG
jgi:hypothetical protein